MTMSLWMSGCGSDWGRATTYADEVRARIVIATAIVVALAPTAAAAEDARELCRFDGDRLAEISGLASSALHAGIVWAHNDSGGSPNLYAIDTQTCEIRATLRVRGARATDPEAIAVGTGSTGAPAIWWGDIGDNRAQRSYLEIHEITEPTELVDASVTPLTYRVRLGRPEDAEALLADGDRLWMIGKGLAAGTIWKLPAPLPADKAARARVVGSEDALVTDAAMRPGGGYAVRDYLEVRIYSGLPPGRLVERMPLPQQIQGEAMTWTTDGEALIVASEGDDRLLLVPVSSPVESPVQEEPTEVRAPTQAPTSPVDGTPTPAPSPVAEALESVDRVGSLAVLALAIGVGVFIVSAAAVPVITRLRRRR